MNQGQLQDQPFRRDAVDKGGVDQVGQGGGTEVVRSSSDLNVKANLMGHEGTMANIQVQEDVCVSKTDSSGGEKVVSESFGGEFMGPTVPTTSPVEALVGEYLTLGEALQAAAMTVGRKPVDQTDAAAIREVETRILSQSSRAVSGAIGADAEAAATHNESATSKEDKTTLSDVLAELEAKLPRDKKVTREDAEAVIAAEMKDSPETKMTTPGGVADSVAAADRLNALPPL